MQFIDTMEQTTLDLGVNYTPEQSTFRVFAPTHKKIILAIYEYYDDIRRKEYSMSKVNENYFEYTINGDLEGKFYTYIVGENEVIDPYSVACSVNSHKTAIIDLNKTNPAGFKEHMNPDNKWENAILYEVHVADFTAYQNSGAQHNGKFLGFAQENTFYNNVKTGLDHLSELGVTHIHLLPIYDFITVDERKDITKYRSNYNWGYDPELYNCVEGSYSTDPYDPHKRIYELKYLIQKIHDRGMSVVLDVVYNHTFKTKDSNFNVLAPGYYHRNIDGIFSNGSGCGNEFASDTPYGRKFIIDSLLYWVEEYKVDGFRFDLMALIDIDTIETAIEKLREINPNIIIYGEPWMADTSLLATEKQITIGAQRGKNFAIFNPFFRDAIRGDNDGIIKGYVQGDYRYKHDIEKGVVGSVSIDGTYSNFQNPIESINYFNAHDNLIFQDKLEMTNVDKKDQGPMTILAFSLVLMSQGIPFFHAGNEFLRDKKLDHNSYSSSIDVNGIDWSLKEKNLQTFNIIKDLIEFRKESGLFNMTSFHEVVDNMTILKGLKNCLIGYLIRKENKTYLIIHNASNRVEMVKFKKLNLENTTLIWSNGFKNKPVSKIELGAYTSNVYEIEGEIYEL